MLNTSLADRCDVRGIEDNDWCFGGYPQEKKSCLSSHLFSGVPISKDDHSQDIQPQLLHLNSRHL